MLSPSSQASGRNTEGSTTSAYRLGTDKYEKIVPELVQQGYSENNSLVETLRTAPDFAVINKEKREVRLIEVKYRKQLYSEDILKIASRMHQLWNPSYLFVATLDGFYFDEVKKIVEKEGVIRPLLHPFIPPEMQDRYLKILVDFETNR